MSYKVEVTDTFRKEAKKLTKKYPSLKAELTQPFIELEENPTIDPAWQRRV